MNSWGTDYVAVYLAQLYFSIQIVGNHTGFLVGIFFEFEHRKCLRLKPMQNPSDIPFHI